MKHHLLVLVAASALAASQGAMAQMGRGGDVNASAGDWEFRIGPVFTESKNISFQGDSSVKLDSTTGVKIGTGWYVSPHLAIGMNFAWANTSFNGTVCSTSIACSAANPPSIHIENGHVDFSTLNFDGTYTFLDGPLKPFIYQVGGGLQFNFSRTFAVNVDYRYTWFELSHSTGTPALGSVELMFVWRFPGYHY